jgi:tetratricopeptide (TPR) repeat protein
MASLNDSPELIGYFSYARDDDKGFAPQLSILRDQIRHELRAQLGRSFDDFRFLRSNVENIDEESWQAEIANAVGQSHFFIPIITPTLLKSAPFRLELNTFIEREKKLCRKDLIFPLLYISVPGLFDGKSVQDDPVLSIIATREFTDWRKLRFEDPSASTARRAIAKFALAVGDAMRREMPEQEANLQENEVVGSKIEAILAENQPVHERVQVQNNGSNAIARDIEVARSSLNPFSRDRLTSDADDHALLGQPPGIIHDIGNQSVADALSLEPIKSTTYVVKPLAKIDGDNLRAQEERITVSTTKPVMDQKREGVSDDVGTRPLANTPHVALSKAGAPFVKSRSKTSPEKVWALVSLSAIAILAVLSDSSISPFAVPSQMRSAAPEMASGGSNQTANNPAPDARNEAQMLFLKSFELLRSGDLQAARLGFERGLAIDPNNATAIFYLAEIRIRVGDDARALYEKVIAIDPLSEVGKKATNRLAEIAKTNATISKAKQNAGVSGANSASDPCALAADHWTNTETIGTAEAYKDHLAKFANCRFASVATMKIDEIARRQKEEKHNIATAGDKILNIVSDYKSKNEGTLSSFAGVYDGLKTCATSRGLDITTMLEMVNLQVIWFEGDTMVNVRFANPDKITRGELSFIKNFGLADGGAIKLYNVTYENGDQETLGFLRNKLVLGPTITRAGGRETIQYTYAVRCSQEMAVAKGAKKVLDEYSKN